MAQAENLPTSGSTETDALGAALHSAMSGGIPNTEPVSEREAYESELPPSGQSDLESLMDQDTQSGSDQPQNESEPSGEVSDTSDFPEVELKVKGASEPVRIKLDPNSDELRQLLGKGKRFEVAMQQQAQQRKDLEAKLAQFQDYEAKARTAEVIENARELMSQGYYDHAMKALLGNAAEPMIETMLEERLAYQNASPEERLKIDIERQKRSEALKEKEYESKLAKLEAQINGRSEQAREAEFSGYLEDAKGRYDLSQWIEDSDTANNLNELVNAAAMSDIIKTQRQRELKGEPNITQRDIRRAYAQHAKRVIDSFRRQTTETATATVAEQAEVAKQNAQVASTRNYGSNSALSDWNKSGGGMSDLVDMLRRGGKGPI